MEQAKFSANIGLLWQELPFIERINRAGEAGFRAVEFHDHAQRECREEVEAALDRHGLGLISLNTFMGDTFGRAAIPGLEPVARKDIDEAIHTAEFLDAQAIHVLAGCDQSNDAHDVFVRNLEYALTQTDKMILIEPISKSSVHGYFLHSISHAGKIIEMISHPRLKIMFDCFHMRHETNDIAKAFEKNLRHIGHVQIASYPERHEPEDGQIAYSSLIPSIVRLGYEGWFGCEYFPRDCVENGLRWMDKFGTGE